LFPRLLGKIATPEALALSSRLQSDAQNRQSHKLSTAARAVEKLHSHPVKFALPADENGHLYAGLKESEILARISEGDESLRSTLKLVDYTPFKHTGEHRVQLKTPTEEAQTITILVVRKV